MTLKEMARPMAAQPVVDESLVDALRDALVSNALPGELDGFTAEDRSEAAAFVAQVAARRKPNELALQMKSVGGEAGNRRMRLAIVNDDMPFLVDSVASGIASRGLGIHRLLHPVVKASRDEKGNLIHLGEGSPESIIYLELDRADARRRQELVEELREVLAAVFEYGRDAGDFRRIADCRRSGVGVDVVDLAGREFRHLERIAHRHLRAGAGRFAGGQMIGVGGRAIT
jgi:glutamate dehydrogenase